jgi:plastocyanin
MHRLFLASAVTMGLMAAPAAQPPDAGAIAGRVKLKPRVGGAALRGTVYPARTVSTNRPHPIPEIRNVVVYLKDAAARGPLTPMRGSIVQEHETFVPHVLAMTRGSVVDFPNADPIYHNVFSLSSAASFNLGRYPTGETRRQTLTKAGVVKVYCQIHSHMSATILVFDHPYFAIPSDDGAYQLPSVPPGEYTLVGWHERVGERKTQIRVERGRTAAIDLSLPVEDEGSAGQ